MTQRKMALPKNINRVRNDKTLNMNLFSRVQKA